MRIVEHKDQKRMRIMTQNNMQIWDKVCETDREYTRKCNLRGGFTAIDPEYQIKRATEIWGAIGIGWGYDARYEISTYSDNKNSFAYIVCYLTFWHSGDRQNKIGEIACMNELIDKTGRFDDDAGKKALTDCLSKVFAQLGFSADVYMGKFDDNKYVTKPTNKPTGKSGTKPPQTKPKTQSLIQSPVKQGCISQAQIKRLFAIGKQHRSPEQIKEVIKIFGYDHTADIKLKDYDPIIDILQKPTQKVDEEWGLDDNEFNLQT